MSARAIMLMFSQAAQYRRTQGAMWVVYMVLGLLGLMALFLVPFGISKAPVEAVRIGIFVVALLCVFKWQELINVVPLLNTPTHAQLVPGSRRIAQGVVIATWLAMVLIIAAMAGFAFGNPISLALLMGLMLAGLALLGSGCTEGVLMHFAAFMLVARRTNYLPLQVDTEVAVLAVAALLCSAYAFYRIFPQGDRHWRSMERVQKIKQVREGSMPMQSSQPASYLRLVHAVYDAVLNRDCRRPSAISARLWHVLGTEAHWSAPVAVVVALLGGAVAVRLLVPLFGYSLDFGFGLAVGGTSIMMLFGWFWHLLRITIRLHATKTEQALLKLTPGMPQGTALNTLFVTSVLRQAGGLFLLTVALAGAIGLVFDTSASDLLNLLGGASATVLIAASMLRWITKDGNPTSVWPAVVLLLQLLALGVVFMIANRVGSVSLPVFSLAVLILAAVVLWQDRSKVVNGPVVFPFSHS
jgi:hypothetical protein